MKKYSFKSIIVTASSVIFLGIVGYYFLVILPNDHFLQNQMDCQKNALAQYDKQVDQHKIKEKEWEADGRDFDFVTNLLVYDLAKPSFKFSKKLNTCLLKTGYRTPSTLNGVYETTFSKSCTLKDLYTNQILATYHVISYSKMSEDSQKKYNEFLKVEKDLLGTGDCEF